MCAGATSLGAVLFLPAVAVAASTTPLNLPVPDAVVMIGLCDSIARTQEVGMNVLAEHPAVLEDPAPWVIAEEIRNAAVLIKLSFWFNSLETNGLQLRSALIRLTKHALLDAGMTIQAEQRQLIDSADTSVEEESTASMTAAEAVTRPESEVIRNQAARASAPEEGENLLKE